MSKTFPHSNGGAPRITPTTAARIAYDRLGLATCLRGVAQMLHALRDDDPDAGMRAGITSYVKAMRDVAAVADDVLAPPATARAGLASDATGQSALERSFYTVGARSTVRGLAKAIKKGKAAHLAHDLIAATQAFEREIDAMLDREDAEDRVA